MPKAKGLLDPDSIPCGSTFQREALPDCPSVPEKEQRVHGAFPIVLRLIGWAIQLLFLRKFRRGELPAAGRGIARGMADFQGFWIELGGFLSRRTQFFGSDVRGEISRCRPSATLPFEEVKAILEEDLGSPLKILFSEFSERPVRVGMYADAYRARLRRGGIEVIVKVQRPGLEQRLTRDLRIFRVVATFLRRMKAYRSVPWDDVISIFAERKASLLDLRFEASSLRRMRKTLRGHKIHVPKLFRDYSRKRVLVHEYVDAPTLKDVIDYRAADPLGADGWLLANEIEFPVVGRRLFQSMLRQICEDNLFEGDLSPSNLVLLRENRLALVNCGQPSTLDKRFLTVFTLALGAMTRNDYEKFADTLFLLCQSLPAADLSGVRSEIIRLVRTYSGRTELLGATHEEKSLFLLTADIARVLQKNEILLDWQVLKVMTTMGSADESLAVLYPEMNYRKEMHRYAQKATKRQLRAVFQRGILQSVAGVVSPLMEMLRFETASMRKRAQNFRATSGKLSSVFATLVRWAARLIVVGTIVGVWIFLHQHHYDTVDHFAGTDAAEVAHSVEHIHYGWWITIFIGAVILFRVSRDIARRLAAKESNVEQSS